MSVIMQAMQRTSPSSGSFVGSSALLRRTRAHLIDCCMPFYEPTMDKMINLINDYIGADAEQEKAVTSVSPEQLFLSEVQKYKKMRIMRIEDRPHAVDWVKTIVTTHRGHAELLPPIALKQGDSEGITFVITKAKKIYGFLYGTMHNFSSGLGEAEILTKLSLSTQINLLGCSIIGTEMTVKNEPSSNSVEGALMAIADKCGIANIGIDDATCDRSMVGAVIAMEGGMSPIKKEPKFKELDPIEELASYFEGAKDARTLDRVTTIALHSGIIELAWSAALTREATHRESAFQQTLQKKRNQSMAENIDTLLSACEVIGHETPPRCFFAIGVSHLIPTPSIPQSVVELVAKKGWGVKRLVKQETQLTLSREMTSREARSIGELIVHMRRHPLYASQKPYLTPV